MAEELTALSQKHSTELNQVRTDCVVSSFNTLYVVEVTAIKDGEGQFTGTEADGNKGKPVHVSIRASVLYLTCMWLCMRFHDAEPFLDSFVVCVRKH